MLRASTEAPQAARKRTLVPGLILHVDGDMICYSCAGNDETLPGDARQRAMSKINKFKAMSGAERIVVHMTNDKGNKGERYLAATVKPYQGQRKDGRKPKNHAYLCEWLSQYKGPDMQVKVWANREADDGVAACAYHACRSDKGPGYIAIASQDKDFRMMPGLHVDWVSYDTIMVEHGCWAKTNNSGKLFGTKWFWMQMLHGDAADHIPGLEKVMMLDARKNLVPKLCGEKTAEKLLDKCENSAQALNEVLGMYHEYYAEHLGLGYEVADDRFVEQACLLWMRTGIKAEVDDFLTHTGPGAAFATAPDCIKQATVRLIHRIRTARRALDQLAD